MGVRRRLGGSGAKAVVVFTSGCWDLFHVGHLNFLKRAKELGDVLVVGVVTDELMSAYKGEPTIPFDQRSEIVSALRCVDHVVSYDDATVYDIVERYGVDVRAVGPGDGMLETQREQARELPKKGVKYVVLPRTLGVSTTEIKEVCCKALVTSGNCPRKVGAV